MHFHARSLCEATEIGFTWNEIKRLVAVRGLLLGGNVNNGTTAGLAISDSRNTPAIASTNIGSRL